MSEFLRSPEGQVLEIKQGVVVDDKGIPVGGMLGGSGAARLKSVLPRGSFALGLVAAFAIPVALFAGLAALALLGGFVAIFVVLNLVEAFFQPKSRGVGRG